MALSFHDLTLQQRTWWGFLTGAPKPSGQKTFEQSFEESLGVDSDSVGITWHEAIHGDVDPDGVVEDKKHYKEEDDIQLSAIISDLEEHRKKHSVKHATHKVFSKVSIRSSATLELSQYGVPVLTASMTFNALSETTSTGTHLVIGLSDMIARDRITPNPPLSNIISVKQVEGVDSTTGRSRTTSSDTTVENSEPTFNVVFDSHNGKNVLRISSLPLQFALNKVCIQYIIHIFFYPRPPPPGKTEADAATNARRQRQAAQDALLNATSGQRMEHQKNDKKIGEREDAFEVIFEAHAPKIIIPEDSTTEKGYLLLDTGYLKVRGFLGQAGMSWDISLNDVNAGMPKTIADMYSLDQNESLYLVKPFDIDCVIQNVDKSIADTTVDLEIKPELRGELTAVKLDRLCYCMGIAQETLFHKPVDLPGMEKLKALDIMFVTVEMNRPSSSNDIRKVAISGGAADGASAQVNNNDEDASEIKSLITQWDRQKEAETDTRDPTHTGLCLNINMPALALDLSYDNENSNKHLIFEVRSLNTRLLNRPSDIQMEISLKEFAIQDSFRCESQRYLASTPKDSPNLINISYVNIQNRRSPLYQKHGAHMFVNFANLHLNLDVNTLMHLRPFLIVLLHRNFGNQPPQNQAAIPAKVASAANGEPTDLAPAANHELSMTEKPLGMHMTFALQVSIVVLNLCWLIRKARYSSIIPLIVTTISHNHHIHIGPCVL